MIRLFKYRRITGDAFTRGNLYEVDVLKQAGHATYRLGTVIDDDGDERVFFAEDFCYIGEPGEAAPVDEGR